MLRRLIEHGVAVTAFAPTVGALEETYMSTVYEHEGGNSAAAPKEAGK